LKLSLGPRLALSYLAVILICLCIVTPLAWLAVERLYLNTQRDNILAQAQLVAAALGSDAPPATILLHIPRHPMCFRGSTPG